MALIRPRRTLQYPAGSAPGFDPSHVASQNITPGHGLSAVAVAGGKMMSLLRGRPCTNAAVNVSGAINGVVGPSITSTGGASNSITDAGNAAVVDTGQTLAAIIYHNTQANGPVFVGSGTVYASAWYLSMDGATEQLNAYTASGTLSGIVLNNNEPYFIAASNDGNNLNFIAKSLTTGRVQTSTVTGTAGTNATGFTSSGTYTIGSDTFGHQVQYPIAAVSYTPAFLSSSELLAWSVDPWAFWYPNKTINLTSPAATFLAAWARNSNLPVLGTGTY
jgi:hypothetical protein